MAPTKLRWLFEQRQVYTTQGTRIQIPVQDQKSFGTSKIKWLVADQLGTPRIIVEPTGSLVTVKRHDYLPFGEELFAGTGEETVQQGYAGGEGVRQQVIRKERE